MLVDSHCHLDFPDFAPELDAVVARAGAAGVGHMVTISTRVRRHAQVLAIAERYPTFSGYYFTVLKAINTFVANRWMLPEDAPHALNRMLNAGFATGAIKREE